MPPAELDRWVGIRGIVFSRRMRCRFGDEQRPDTIEAS
jgi:hypothetical protein